MSNGLLYLPPQNANAVETDEQSLKNLYSEMADAKLAGIDPSKLTNVARGALEHFNIEIIY